MLAELLAKLIRWIPARRSAVFATSYPIARNELRTQAPGSEVERLAHVILRFVRFMVSLTWRSSRP